MFVSKLTVSDELKQNNLSPREKGRLRWQRLKDLDASGELQFIKTRNDLAKAVGYGDKEPSGVAWTNNVIRRGYVKEVFTGFEGSKTMKEYHLTGKEPDFDFNGVRNRHTKKKAEKKVEQKVEQKTEPMVDENTPLSNALMEIPQPTTILIKKGQMTITITGVDVADVVNKLLK